MSTLYTDHHIKHLAKRLLNLQSSSHQANTMRLALDWMDDVLSDELPLASLLDAMQAACPEHRVDLEDGFHATLATALLDTTRDIGPILDLTWNYLSEKPVKLDCLRQACGFVPWEMPPPVIANDDRQDTRAISRKLLIEILGDHPDIRQLASTAVLDAILLDGADFVAPLLTITRRIDTAFANILMAGLCSRIISNNDHLCVFNQATRDCIETLYATAEDRVYLVSEILGAMHEQLISTNDDVCIDTSHVDKLIDNLKSIDIGTSYKNISMKLAATMMTAMFHENGNPEHVYQKRWPVLAHLYHRLPELHPQWFECLVDNTLKAKGLPQNEIEHNPLARKNPLLLYALLIQYDNNPSEFDFSFCKRVQAAAIINSQPIESILNICSGDNKALMAIYEVRPDSTILPLLDKANKRKAISMDLGL